MRAFLDALRVQRWDDHRYYHHSRIKSDAALRQRAELPVCLFFYFFYFFGIQFFNQNNLTHRLFR